MYPEGANEYLAERGGNVWGTAFHQQGCLRMWAKVKAISMWSNPTTLKDIRVLGYGSLE